MILRKDYDDVDGRRSVTSSQFSDSISMDLVQTCCLLP